MNIYNKSKINISQQLRMTNEVQIKLDHHLLKNYMQFRFEVKHTVKYLTNKM